MEAHFATLPIATELHAYLFVAEPTIAMAELILHQTTNQHLRVDALLELDLIVLDLHYDRTILLPKSNNTRQVT